MPREVTDAATAKRDAASCAYQEVIAAASPVYKAAVEEYERAETDLSEVAEIAAIEAVRETLSDSDKICFDERVQTMKDNKESCIVALCVDVHRFGSMGTNLVR